MKKKVNLIEAAMKYNQIIIAFVLIMMILGVYGLLFMPRNEFPEFTIRQGLIIGVYPGATSSEVEEQLTTVVENYIFGYEEVNKAKTYSHSKEGMMIVFVELNDNIKNADKFWSKLRLGLEELKAQQLPIGVLALLGTNDFGDTSALLVTMSSKEKNYRELEEIMRDMEADIRKIHSVSKIKRYGTQKENIYVYVNYAKLNEYNIKPAAVFAVFQMQNAYNYAGDLDNGKLVLPVHLPPRYNSEKELEQQIIYSDPEGNIIRLKDVARIERKFEDPTNYIRNNKNNALLLSLEMQNGNNIVQFGKEVEEILAQFKKKTSADVEINVISNLPEAVDNSISHFMKEFLIAIVAVIIVTMLLLPFRIASVAAVTIPISVLITIGIMQMVGIQLDIVTLAGLIVVLGMVVDNAIVVIDNHVEKLDHGETPWNAARKAAIELFIPVLSATFAIIAAFFPLMLLLKGMALDFVGDFPVTIGIALVISMVIAMLLVPFMCFVFIKKGLHKKEVQTRTKGNGSKSFLDTMQNIYDLGLAKTFKYPKTTIFSGTLSIVIAIILFTHTDQQLFPTVERKQFAVEIHLPEGFSIDKTEEVIDSLEKILLQDQRITNVASFIGNGSPRFHTLYAPHMPALNYGQILVNTISNEATVEILDEYSVKYYDVFPNAHINWVQIAFKKFATPIEVRISGNSIKELKETSCKVAEILSAHKKTTWVRTDWQEMRQGISVELDINKSNQLGYAKSFVASSLMVATDGLPLTTIWEGDYPVSVILSKEDHLKDNISDLEDQYVTSPITFESLPLRSIATLKPEWTEGNIVRRNGVRTMTVLADVQRNTIYANVFKDVRPLIDNLELPDGVKIEYGGEHADMIENFIPFEYSLGVSVILIFFIILFEFKTFRRTLLIMSTMLLSLFGAVLGLKIIGYPFSLTAFIGLIGLMGLTVRNGIILVDYAMQLVTKEGFTYKDAAIAAGKRRMRPIFLTSMAAAVGVIPMILSKSALWGPLGTVICFGLIFGMILTLFVLPVLYWKSIGKEKFVNEELKVE